MTTTKTHDSLNSRARAEATIEFGNRNRKAAASGRKHVAVWAFDAAGTPTRCLECGRSYNKNHRGITH